MGEMEIEEIEAVLEKIWDLHDKLSDEIHLISRSHFLKSVKPPANRSEKKKRKSHGQGYVIIKGLPVDDNDDATIQEAKSLNAIRTALEHLEDQLEFFHTIHTQQRTERDVAVARLEQSRILLAMRLSEHHGKSYGVLDEALAFVGSIKTPTNFELYNSSPNPTGANSTPSGEPNSNFVVNAFAWTFGFAKRALGFNHVRGVLGNAAIFAISMVAMLHLQHVASSEHHHLGKKDDRYQQRRTYRREMSSSEISLDHLDVMMARG